MRPVLAIAAVALVSLALGWNRARAIESGLGLQVATAMATAGYKGVEVAIDGRDVVLEGEVGSVEAKQMAERTAEHQPGVRVVANHLRVATALPGPDSEHEYAVVEEATLSLEVCQSRIDELLLETGIDFESSSAELIQTSEAVLTQLTEALVDCGSARIEIAGHTDASGPRDENLELSLRRAESVLDDLTRRGIATDRLTAVGYGPDQPLVDNATPEGRALNRRIEFKVQEPDS